MIDASAEEVAAGPPGVNVAAPGLKTKLGAAALNEVVEVLGVGGLVVPADEASLAALAPATFVGLNGGMGERLYGEDFFSTRAGWVGVAGIAATAFGILAEERFGDAVVDMDGTTPEVGTGVNSTLDAPEEGLRVTRSFCLFSS